MWEVGVFNVWLLLLFYDLGFLIVSIPLDEFPPIPAEFFDRAEGPAFGSIIDPLDFLSRIPSEPPDREVDDSPLPMTTPDMLFYFMDDRSLNLSVGTWWINWFLSLCELFYALAVDEF